MSKRKPPSSGRIGSGDYQVGKGRPPRDKQWQPGQSGNPPGRRKGSKNRKTIVRAAERKMFTVTKAGRKRKMTATEIGLEFLLKDVARGDRKALLDWLAIMERYSPGDESIASMKELLAEDTTILANLIARKKRSSPKPKGEK